MKACQLMTKNIEVCTPQNTVAEVVSIMIRKDCGFVPVVLSLRNKVLKGVVTDRDIAIFLGLSSRCATEAKIKEFYTRDAVAVFEDTDVDEVARLMEHYQIHRIPVVDPHNRIVGIVSLRDLAQKAQRTKATQNPEVTEAQIGEIVEAISVRRKGSR